MTLAIVWNKEVSVPTALGMGAHIGFLPVAALLNIPVLQWEPGNPPAGLADYDTILLNVFPSTLPLAQDIRQAAPHARLIASVDTVPETGLLKPAILEQIALADAVGYRADSNRFYAYLFGKEAVWIPIAVGYPAYFARARQQAKQDFIIVAGHSAAVSNIGTLAALKRVQGETRLPIKWAGGRDEDKALASRIGLDIEWLPYLVYSDYVTLAARARLGIDLYPAHSVGRNEITLAYAGTPFVGSRMTHCKAGIKVDPFDTQGAYEASLKLLSDSALYDTLREIGIFHVETHFSFIAVRQYFEEVFLMSEKQTTKRKAKKQVPAPLQDKSIGDLAEMNTAESLNEFWSRPEVRESYYNEQRLKHFEIVVDYAGKIFDWNPDWQEVSVLDAGCGAGHLLSAIQRRFGDRIEKLVGVDYAASAIEWAKETTPAAEYHVEDLSQLSLPDDSFDIVFCCQVLEHQTDFEAVLKQLVRVARHHVILTVPDGALDNWRAHVNFWKLEEFKRLLEFYGLRDIKYIQSTQQHILARLYAPYAKK